MYRRFWIIFLLGFSSGLPFPLLSSTLQAWFADQGMSIAATGMLSLLGLPYALKFLWAPVLDYFPLSRLGKRRSWMLLSQVLLLFGLAILGCCSPGKQSATIAAIALLLSLISATQDIAIEAQRTEYLLPKEYGLGASLAVLGYRIALLLAGGLALIIAHHWGWTLAYLSLTSLLLLGIFATLLSPETSAATALDSKPAGIFLRPLHSLFKQPDCFSLLAFIFCFKLGEAFTSTTSGIVMPFLIQGLGFPLDLIGYVNKIVAMLAVLLGGLLAGLLLLRGSLYKALLYFGLLQALSNLLFVFLAKAGASLSWLLIAVFADNFATGLGTTALVALIMQRTDKRYTASQFSILTAVASLPRVFSGPVGAFIQSQVGWVGLYQLSVVAALFFLPFLFMIRQSLMQVLEKDHGHENA